ncbi:hypothetical protein KAR91_13740 [Candidatus Pacearchaeota archaeon]|nr:hypothetical protein [Candidatus Pacearchaeota archaeon]
MKDIKVITGFGYFKDAKGYTISTAILPIGVHPLDEEITYVECATQAELDKIIITRPIEEEQTSQIQAVKIEAKKRIIELVPTWSISNYIEKQQNAVLCYSKLLRKEQKDSISSKEIAELDNLDVLVTAMEDIRNASNAIEAEILNITVIDKVKSFGIVDNPLWP